MRNSTTTKCTISIVAFCLMIAGACRGVEAQAKPATVAPVATHPRPGEMFRDCPDCPDMVVIPAGTFTMGAPKDEPGFYDEDGPQRTVKIHQFAAGKFDVTKGQWSAFVAATDRPTVEGCQWSFLPKEKEGRASWRYLGFEQDDSHPAVCVTWKDTQDYLAWIGQRAGRHYRLLSEAEWEYAARAGTTTPYPWGSKASHEQANYGGDDHAGYGVAMGRDQWANSTSPVGSFPPNAFGVYDMHGNVLQWVADCLATTYAGLPTDGSAYQQDVLFTKVTGYFATLNGTRSCSYRVLRGGDYADTPQMIRSASRNWAPPSDSTLEKYSSSGVGIRVARDLN